MYKMQLLKQDIENLNILIKEAEGTFINLSEDLKKCKKQEQINNIKNRMNALSNFLEKMKKDKEDLINKYTNLSNDREKAKVDINKSEKKIISYDILKKVFGDRIL